MFIINLYFLNVLTPVPLSQTITFLPWLSIFCTNINLPTKNTTELVIHNFFTTPTTLLSKVTFDVLQIMPDDGR